MLVRRDALRRALGHVHQAPQDAPRGVLVAVRLRGSAEARTASLVAAVATRDDWANHFTVVEEDRIRMTPLPRRE